MASDGRKRATIKSSTQTLRILNKNVNLMEPEAVKLYVANSTNLDGTPTSDARKHKHVWNYNYFVKANGLTWTKPKYKYDLKVPITPTRDQAEAIIASAPSMNSATVFRILLETGFEGEELHCTKEKDIDTEQGIITVEGHKMHNGRSYKLKTSTAEMLRVYMRKHNRLHPFAKPSIMWQQWKIARTRASNKLSRPDLQKIPLKGLRNLSGIIMWQKTRDPWTVMLHMGHKKLDTTQHYLRAMTTQLSQNLDQEYITKAVQLGTQNTIKEIMELIEAGFRKETEADGYQIYRKPK
jgi:integrase